jgi:ABC-type siderophore export system fused ATPase/permease subunit
MESTMTMPTRTKTQSPALHRVDNHGLLDRLVDPGKAVIVIEHHQAVMAHADWIIDLGPGPATTCFGRSNQAARELDFLRDHLWVDPTL